MTSVRRRLRWRASTSSLGRKVAGSSSVVWKGLTFASAVSSNVTVELAGDVTIVDVTSNICQRERSNRTVRFATRLRRCRRRRRRPLMSSLTPIAKTLTRAVTAAGSCVDDDDDDDDDDDNDDDAEAAALV